MNVYVRIINLILEKLKQGTVPWHQPWSVDTWPQNLTSGHQYRGINVFLLASAGYASPYWLTFKQVQSKGGKVRKGERGTPIVYWSLLEKADESEEIRLIPLLRYYTVFNLEQCRGISKPAAANKESEWQPLAQCEAVVTQMPHKPEIVFGKSKAYYNYQQDRIHIPARESFTNVGGYYNTLFHELVHSTGHPSRLNRQTMADATYFGSTNYSKEELIAEMGAAFLCAHTGIENSTIDNSAAYIAGWLERLQFDTRLVINAAAQAQKAFNYILNLSAESPKAAEVATSTAS